MFVNVQFVFHTIHVEALRVFESLEKLRECVESNRWRHLGFEMSHLTKALCALHSHLQISREDWLNVVALALDFLKAKAWLIQICGVLRTTRMATGGLRQ